MVMMKKVFILISLLLTTLCITGCNQKNEENLAQNMKKIELTGNLVTYKAFYHNVIEHEKEKGSGVSHWLEKDRKLFAEYTGTIKLGINLSEVKVDVKGNQIDVSIPKAIIIGKPNVDKDDFKEENFIESKEGINKNTITGEDVSKAFDKAQANMEENASGDTELLSIAQKRAKIVLEEKIKQLSGMPEDKYVINWKYEQ